MEADVTPLCKIVNVRLFLLVCSYRVNNYVPMMFVASQIL